MGQTAARCADSTFRQSITPLPHSETGGLPRICTVFRPGKSRSFTVKVCSPNRDTKAELNRRGQACEVLAGTGISRRVKWSERGVSRPVFLLGRQVCLPQHLCSLRKLVHTFALG